MMIGTGAYVQEEIQLHRVYVMVVRLCGVAAAASGNQASKHTLPTVSSRELDASWPIEVSDPGS